MKYLMILALALCSAVAAAPLPDQYEDWAELFVGDYTYDIGEVDFDQNGYPDKVRYKWNGVDKTNQWVQVVFNHADGTKNKIKFKLHWKLRDGFLESVNYDHSAEAYAFQFIRYSHQGNADHRMIMDVSWINEAKDTLDPGEELYYEQVDYMPDAETSDMVYPHDNTWSYWGIRVFDAVNDWMTLNVVGGFKQKISRWTGPPYFSNIYDYNAGDPFVVQVEFATEWVNTFNEDPITWSAVDLTSGDPVLADQAAYCGGNYDPLLFCSYHEVENWGLFPWEGRSRYRLKFHLFCDPAFTSFVRLRGYKTNNGVIRYEKVFKYTCAPAGPWEDPRDS